jgi:hypothetical protein
MASSSKRVKQFNFKYETIQVEGTKPKLEVDDAFKPFWEGRTNIEHIEKKLPFDTDGVKFGRLTLSAAQDAAIAARFKDVGPNMIKWEQNSKALARVVNSLNSFKRSASSAAWPLQESIRHILLTKFYQQNLDGHKPDVIEMGGEALRVSKAFEEILSFAQSAETVTAAHADLLARYRPNPGNPEPIAFAEKFIEAYVYLYSSPPIRNKKFLDLLSLAWADVCPEEVSWENPARTAIKRIKSIDTSSLKRNGPYWV